MNLQRELSFDTSALNARLSRVVTKLFTRVIKAEDAENAPWSSVDAGNLLESLNTHFAACSDKEPSVASSNNLHERQESNWFFDS